MPKGTRTRSSYKRDSHGRFASVGTSSAKAARSSLLKKVAKNFRSEKSGKVWTRRTAGKELKQVYHEHFRAEKQRAQHANRNIMAFSTRHAMGTAVRQSVWMKHGIHPAKTTRSQIKIGIFQAGKRTASMKAARTLIKGTGQSSAAQFKARNVRATAKRIHQRIGPRYGRSGAGN